MLLQMYKTWSKGRGKRKKSRIGRRFKTKRSFPDAEDQQSAPVKQLTVNNSKNSTADTRATNVATTVPEPTDSSPTDWFKAVEVPMGWVNVSGTPDTELSLCKIARQEVLVMDIVLIQI